MRVVSDSDITKLTTLYFSFYNSLELFDWIKFRRVRREAHWGIASVNDYMINYFGNVDGSIIHDNEITSHFRKLIHNVHSIV